MNRLKYYAVAFGAALVALLLAVIRHKNNRIGELGADLAKKTHEANIEIKAKELTAAKEKYYESRKKFDDWEKGRKPGSDS